MKNTIVITGLPRCGSALVLQMLTAAGIRCAGEFPLFDPDSDAATPDFVDSMAGGAFKLLNPHSVNLPTGRRYRFIHLGRSRRQQAKSMVKFMVATGNIPPGKDITEDGMERMRETLAVDYAACSERIKSYGCPVLRVRFEDLIERPEKAAAKIAEFLSIDEHVAAMIACVRPRSAQSFPGLLELELMAESYDPMLCQCKMPPFKSPCDYCEAQGMTIADKEVASPSSTNS